jgi:hypothetical protein
MPPKRATASLPVIRAGVLSPYGARLTPYCALWRCCRIARIFCGKIAAPNEKAAKSAHGGAISGLG